jgi:hypothetical protein
MSKSPITALNEVLLAAAIRAERANEERLRESERRQLAKRNDNYASEYRHHRVISNPKDARAGN